MFWRWETVQMPSYKGFISPLLYTSLAAEKEHDIILVSRSIANYTIRTRLVCLNSIHYIRNQFPKTVNT